MWQSLHFLQHFSLLTSILPIILLMCSWQKCEAKPKGEICAFNGHQYQAGETFHTTVYPMKADHCVKCICQANGQVQCSKTVDCPTPDCQNPKYVDGECCPICEVEVEKSRQKLTPSPGCDYDGGHYEEEEQFSYNNTILRPKRNQCVLCQCYHSEVFCHLKTCIPTPNCLKSITVSDDCCQQCAEYEVSSVQPSKKNRLKPGDCMSSSMGPQKNGTTWKPVVGHYGTMECVVCKCQDGRVHCNRVQCPADYSHKCKRPQFRKGKCCRECPRKNRTERKVEGTNKKNKKNDNDDSNSLKDRKTGGNKKKCKKEKGGNRKKRKGKKKKKRCKSKKRNKKVSEKETNPSTKESTGNNMDAITMDTAKGKLCVDKKADYLVYVTKGDNSFSLMLDNLKSNGTWEKRDWTIRKGFITSSKKSLLSPSSPLRHQITTKHLIGSAIKRNSKKFFKKLEKKLEKCKKKCRRKILEKTMKRLKIKSVNLKKFC